NFRRNSTRLRIRPSVRLCDMDDGRAAFVFAVPLVCRIEEEEERLVAVVPVTQEARPRAGFLILSNRSNASAARLSAPASTERPIQRLSVPAFPPAFVCSRTRLLRVPQSCRRHSRWDCGRGCRLYRKFRFRRNRCCLGNFAGFLLRALNFHATLQESAVVDPDSARDDLALNGAVTN